MKRLSTIISDLQYAMADLEMLASTEEDKEGFQPGRAQRVGQLLSAAGGISQMVSQLQGVK